MSEASAGVERQPWPDLALGSVLVLGVGLGAGSGWKVDDLDRFARSMWGGFGGALLGVWAFLVAWAPQMTGRSSRVRGTVFEAVRLVVPVILFAASVAAIGRAQVDESTSLSGVEVGLYLAFAAAGLCFVLVKTRPTRKHIEAWFRSLAAVLTRR